MKDTVGEYLRKSRVRAGWTQAQAAQALGISQGILSMYETGRHSITVERANLLCEKYNVPEIGPLDRYDNDDDEYMSLDCVRALLDLSASNEELAQGMDQYICMAAYIMMRKLYSLNPTRSQRIFKIDEERFKRVQKIFDGMPDDTASYALYSPKVHTRELKPTPDEDDTFKRLIEYCEKNIY